jgi:hypothetical protein
MTSEELFYTPPKDEYFNELKKICIRFWEVNFEDETDYLKEKVNRLLSLKNEGANFSYMVQMIHPISRKVIAKSLSLETRNEISMRIHGWGEDDKFDPFNIWDIENNIDDDLI